MRYMAVNVRLNRVTKSVHMFNLDGRDFVRLLCATPGGPVERLAEMRQGQGVMAELGGGGRAGARCDGGVGGEGRKGGGKVCWRGGRGGEEGW